MDIAGKVFIVTGSASGLGEGTARMLAREGAKVVIADLQERGRPLADVEERLTQRPSVVGSLLARLTH